VGLVNDLVQLLAHADMDAILMDFGQRTRQDDVAEAITVHFYETFLAAYDPALRERRGVYYTPTPVVSFIVRSVDALLKSKFGLLQGLADTRTITLPPSIPPQAGGGRTSPSVSPQAGGGQTLPKVLILDPATGTGTFLYSVIAHIRAQFMRGGNAGMWSGFVREHLLPRIFGFELLMAPYAVAHFKLAFQLAGHDLSEAQQALWAYDFASDERIQVYLTNTLEAIEEEIAGLFGPLRIVTEEAQQANRVKRDLPIMVVLGNPPYSGHSANKGEWIGDLLHGRLPDGRKGTSYYEVDGHPLRERNTKWLQDDYVKFIRFGQWRIEQSGGGVLAYISNNGYLDNPTFRGMRQSLMETFTAIYVLDLHGNARKKEIVPDGTPDENVFDIMQGVAIGLFVKDPDAEGPAKVYHADLWGKRAEKYRGLVEEDVETVTWEELEPQKPFYLFIPQETDLLAEYEQGQKISEIMPLNSMGVTTGRDAFAVSFSANELQSRIRDLASSKSDEVIRTQYRLKDSSSFSLETARVWAKQPDSLSSIQVFDYRCFDLRYVIYSSSILARAREEVCKHQIGKKNLVLTTFRAIRELPWQHVFIAEHAVAKEFISSLDNCYMFPLYLYPDEDAATLFDSTDTSAWEPDADHGNRVPNLAPAFVAEMEEKLGLAFAPFCHSECSEESRSFDYAQDDRSFGPRDVLAYIYAVFHSPTYRERYAELLKIDFPRVPLTSDRDLFWQLVSLGSELIALHLLDLSGLERPDRSGVSFPIPGDNRVKRRGGFPTFIPAGESRTKTSDVAERNRVYINLEQYFAGVPEEVWDFEVGGYQVLHKWLKDRKGRVLSYGELEHYQQMVVALKETLRLMGEVDATIGGWPMG
jgi:predicted helicase